MKRVLRMMLVLFCGAAGDAAAQAGSVLPRIRNQLSAAGPVANSSPSSGATPGNFRSATLTSGGAPGQASAQWRLPRSMAGAPFAIGVPDHAFGDIIPPPPLAGGVRPWRAEPVKPGEVVRMAGMPANHTPVPAGAARRYYYSSHAEAVYAAEPGQVEVAWRSLNPDNDGNFTVLVKNYIISPVPARPVNRMFWTEVPYSAPMVALPDGVQQAYIHYRAGAFPATSGGGVENRTFWLDEQPGFKSFRAQRITGRVFVELLGPERDAATQARVSLGVRVVDVLSEPVAGSSSFVVRTWLGERLRPSDGDPQLVPHVQSGLTESPPFITNRTANGVSAWHAERTTANASSVVLYWKERDELGLEWPRMRNQYELVWPDSPDAYVLNALGGGGAGAFVDFRVENTPSLLWQDGFGEASLEGTRFVVQPGADGVNRALVVLQSGPRFWYLRVFSAVDGLFAGSGGASTVAGRPSGRLTAVTATAEVGARILPPPLPPGDGGPPLSRAGHIVRSAGDLYAPEAYLDPLEAGFPAAEQRSEIIPVNVLASKPRLRVWWYRRVPAPSPEFQPLLVPGVVGTYNLTWPAVDPDPEAELVIARNNGTGDLPPEVAAGRLYRQNNPALPGYNPNEEHAMMIGGRAYALRDDLNGPESSDAHVLIRYAAADGRPAMRVFKVLRENAVHLFRYPATAGTLLTPPAPLSFLAPPVADGRTLNREKAGEADAGTATPAHYDRFTYEDRNHQLWIYRGPHAGGAPTFTMTFRYPVQPGFDFPGVANAPQPGATEPFLRVPGLGGEGVDVVYVPSWPAVVPRLAPGQTLTKAFLGLPAVRGRTSLEVIYEQSRAQDPVGARRSVSLFDATRAKRHLLGTTAGGQVLDRLPASAATETRNGKVYFQNLPPHLRQRFYMDPALGSRGALVLEGRFVDDVVGEDYLLLNVLSAADLAAVQALVPATDGANKAKWDTVVRHLTTSVETFEEDPAVPGRWRPRSSSMAVDSLTVAEITDANQAVDSYALAPAGGGSGYVTLISGNGAAFSPAGEPVALLVMRVEAPLHQGQIKVLTAANPLDEKVTLRHSSDFAGRPEDHEFEWRWSPPIAGVAPALTSTADDPGPAWSPVTADGPLVVVGGAGVQTLADSHWIMRWRPRPVGQAAPGPWSEWTAPALVEGWIKRALAGINPFNQRVTDFFGNAVNTDVSILTQAGTRWEGDVALNLDNIDEFGLIEIYETILNRGVALSIDGSPPLDYGPANDALLLAAGYLSDLYSVLGDEAAADAANPTVAFDGQALGGLASPAVASDFASVFSQTSTARFAFQGQVANLLEEELALLRGRDDAASPGVELAPAYNRLFWNYTRGINAGEVIYALNYNIRERQEAGADGKIDAADAARQYPQGHGDAYGHHLSALKNYYRLLGDEQFTWTPRVETVNVLGVPVQVDYLDERKFAGAAGRVTRTALKVAGLVHRRSFSADRSRGWRHFREGSDPAVNFREGRATSAKRRRHWGLDDWIARGAQGSYFHWVTANSVLPAVDNVNEGVRKIDRTTVPELDDLALAAGEFQAAADKANHWLNPLGLSADSMLFDISPSELAAGKPHFEQIWERAVRALGNAFDSFDRAADGSRLLRSLENQSDDLATAVADEERAFNLRLTEIYGTPHAGDIGPGRTYPQGYDGPDLFRWFYIEQTTGFSDPFNGGEPFETTLRVTIDPYRAREFYPENPDELTADGRSADGVPGADPLLREISYTIRPDSFAQYATPEMGRRQRPGQLQMALQDLNAKREDLIAILDFYNRNEEIFRQTRDSFVEALRAHEKRQDISARTRDTIRGLLAAQAILETAAETSERIGTVQDAVATAITDSMPMTIGVANDPSFPARGTVGAAYVSATIATQSAALVASSAARAFEASISYVENGLDRQLEEAGLPPEFLRMAAEVQAAYYDWLALGSNIDQMAIALSQSRMALEALVAEGESVQRSREIFRRRAAVATQGYRTRDVAFRTFRSEALEQYQTLLDWATRYAWLAAKAYDYETGLLGSAAGQRFLGEVSGTRALGLRNAAGEPIFAASGSGDPGLSGLLARLRGDWSSVRTRLGFNNPDTNGTVFSLRGELFRIPPDAASTDGDTDANNDSQEDRTWKERLQSCAMSDLRTDADVAMHCLELGSGDLPVPGFLIPFSGSVEEGKNFFGLPLAGGDSAFTTTSFATKIHSAGVAFDGYVGMNLAATGSPLAGGPASGAPNALSATPYVHLIPAGRDVMRTPPLGEGSRQREFMVQDYALPLPFNIGAIPDGASTFWTGASSLSEPFLVPRRHQAFRAVDQAGVFFTPLSADFTNRRLVGRSVWNTTWKLVIPATTLLNNPTDGMSRFLRSVRDIRLYLRTYSYSGN